MKKISEMSTADMEDELGTNIADATRKEVIGEKLYENYKYGY